MKAVGFTLGCKVNACESQSIIKNLEDLGYEVDIELSYADLYVINTCAVTKEAEKKSVSLLLFPELCITGVSCNDLFCFPSFCQKAELALEQIKQSTADCTVAFCVGLPRKKGNALYNAMVLIQRGEEKCENCFTTAIF